MAFTQKLIEIKIQLASNTQLNQPNVFDNGSDTVTISGARTSVRIRNSGAPTLNEATVDVWGLAPSLMNQLSTLGMQINIVPRNTIVISAGDAESGLTIVYSGTIVTAYGDYNAAPDVPAHFECQFGLAQATAPAMPSSFPGSASVASMMQGFAGQLGCGFSNNGVSAQLSNAYFRGSLMSQIGACADHGGIGAAFTSPYDAGGNPTLAIFPKFGSKGNAPASPPLIAPPPDGTMVGYPSYTQQGIVIKTVFDPRIEFFGLVQTKSSLPKATGTWIVHKLDHALDSQVPHGEWMSTVYCYSPNAPNPVLLPN